MARISVMAARQDVMGQKHGAAAAHLMAAWKEMERVKQGAGKGGKSFQAISPGTLLFQSDPPPNSQSAMMPLSYSHLLKVSLMIT